MSVSRRRILLPFFLVLRSAVSLVPSAAPTFFKSSEPSAVPSVNTLVDATALPSMVPTLKGSEQPSTSFLPTPSPTVTVTNNNVLSTVPTYIPTDIPSISSDPTFEPSFHPTLSTFPSEQPTRTKSSNPSTGPTYSPSEQKSDYPSPYPSFLPTDEGVKQKTPDIEMILNGIAIEMQTDEIKSYFERMTSNHILLYWNNQSKPIPFFSVTTQIKSQNVISSQDERYLSENHIHHMDEGVLFDKNTRSLEMAQLEVMYTHEFELKADATDTIISSDLYLLPFQEDGGQQFLNSLIANDPSSEMYFQYVESISVRSVDKSSSKITIIIISVSVVVGVIFILSLWCVFVRGKCKRTSVNEDHIVDLNVAPSVSFNNDDDDDVSEEPFGKYNDDDNDEGISYADSEYVRTWTGPGNLATTEILRVVDLPNDDSNSDDDDKSGSFSA